MTRTFPPSALFTLHTMPSPNARGYFCLTLGHGTRTGRKERGGGQRSTHQDAFVKAVVPMERAPQRYSTLPGMHAGSAWFARMLDYQQAHVRTPAMIPAPLGAPRIPRHNDTGLGCSNDFRSQVRRLSKWLVRHKGEERKYPDFMPRHAQIVGLGRSSDGAKTLWACIMYVRLKYE